MNVEVVWFERGGAIGLGAVTGGGAKRVVVLDEAGRSQRVRRERVLHQLQARVRDDGAQQLSAHLRGLDERLRGEAVEPPDPELLYDCMEEGRAYSLAELAGLCFVDPGDAEVSALVRCLERQGGARIDPSFRLRDGRLQRVAPDLRARLLAREAEAQAREEAHARFLSWFRGEPGRAPEPEQATLLEALRSYALEGARSPSVGEAKPLLRALELSDPDALLDELEGRGLVEAHANELPHRRGVPVRFTRALLDEAAARVAAAAPPTGEDLRHLPTVAIDDPGTVEVDDALSTWEEDGTRFLAIHIARVAGAIAVDDPLDAEARRRATSIYFPCETIPMLPPQLGSERYSLRAGADREALSLVCALGPDGLPGAVRFTPSVIRVDEQAGYDAEGGLAGELVATLQPLAQALRAARVGRGASVASLPWLKIKVDAAGAPELQRVFPDSPAWRVVSELMVFYNARVAEALVAGRAPALFRVQPEPLRLPRDLDPQDPLYPLRLRRALPRTDVLCQAGPQRTMGLEAYLQATSPLRRMGDLLAQRQLLALLRGEPLPYRRAAMESLREQLLPAERRARQLEDERRLFWICRWLAARPDERLEGLVWRAGARPLVYLPQLERTLPCVLDEALPVGHPVRARAVEVHPRRREVLLRASAE